MRILLEAEAARQAARTRGPADVAALSGLLARDRALSAPADPVRVATNTELHEAVWRAARNPVLHDLLGRLTVHLVHAPRSTLSVDTRWAESLDEHAAVVASISRGDEAAAHGLMADHMRRARDVRLALLRDAAAADAASPESSSPHPNSETRTCPGL